MIRRHSPALECSRSAFKIRQIRRTKSGLSLLAVSAAATSLMTAPGPLHAQALNCDLYARNYADAHVSGDPTDLHIVDQAMEGAVAGGAWRGPSGARRGARAGAALGVLDTLGDYPAGWRGLYDLAYRLCRNSQSPVTHRPTTLGDPSHHPAPPRLRAPEPPLPAIPAVPQRPEN